MRAQVDIALTPTTDATRIHHSKIAMTDRAKVSEVQAQITCQSQPMSYDS